VSEPEQPEPTYTQIFDELHATWEDWYAARQANEAVLTGSLDGDEDDPLVSPEVTQ
jgi:hypothetical protein